ncbi:M23 family metallopeptidase [uncultured Lacinutrix sp.]|uniref:M23 family metallopeptidase n=1 Tax=uncultured Lacinutrix sp. TaxID=574032 RepID=UPI00261991D0|nr:M23 family metallopeptidase [uncultured Lacinutrix sp.]
MKLFFLLLSLFILLSSCAKKIIKPSYISFELSNDSIYIKSINNYNCPVFNTIKNLETGKKNYIQFKALETKNILSFHINEEDSISILEKIKFSRHYGYFDKNKQSHDSLFNYELPYLKGKTYKIIQGYNGNFTHNNNVSRYTLDFNTKKGDTITASRGGIVIKSIMNNDKQGTTSKFRPYANYIIIYHKDNTFAQYVHLKKESSFIKVGDSVRINQPIALSGFTGWTTVPHLHFGVFKSSKKGIYSIPIILDSIAGKNYKKNKTYLND